MVKRALEQRLHEMRGYFPVVSLTGPRQSGKTTLLKQTFSDYPYLSLENPSNRELAIRDPENFLSQFNSGVILDEIQKAPELFSYIQEIVDQNKERKFILSGSQNFLLSEKISQTLAGRVGILTLLPFSRQELKGIQNFNSFEEWAFKGAYPRIYDQNIPPDIFYSSYIQTYIERDVREIKNILDLNAFTRFLKLCAGRVGQLLNLSSLANDCGIAVSTAKQWISLLEASYVVFLLQPHHKNFNKRLIKMPKLYFYDTGLLCYLLQLESAEQLKTHYAKGAVFENVMLLELLKKRLNNGQRNNLYFWRDHKGLEIDCIIEQGELLTPIEFKAGSTKSLDFFKSITYWNKLSGNKPENSYVIYAGNESIKTGLGNLRSWKDIDL